MSFASIYTLFYIASPYAFLFARVVLGVILLYHGWPKIKNMKATAAWFGSVGFRPGIFWAPLVSIVEFFGGLALLLGFFTQATAFVVMGQFVVISIWKIITRQPFQGGIEFDLIILATAFILATTGAGAFSLDGFFFGI